MSKKPVAYIKPQDPSFLAKLKKEAGYVEGPTVDTKREPCHFEDGSDEEINEEAPVVVVLKQGDLTAEEAEQIEKQKENEKADLSKRVIFQQPSSSKRCGVDQKASIKQKKSKFEKKRPVLSFDEEED